MNALWLTIPLSLLIAVAFLGAFLWASRSGQFEDVDTPAHRMLVDDMDEVKGVAGNAE